MLQQEQLLERINECQTVLDKLESSDVWQIVSRDAKRWVEEIDTRWQDITDEKQMLNARICKLSYNYVLNIRKRYEQDLEFAKEALKKIDNVGEEIQCDYDLETKIEE